MSRSPANTIRPAGMPEARSHSPMNSSISLTEAASVSEIDEFIGECERASGIPAGRIVLAGERDIGRGYSQNLFFWFSNKGSRRALEDNTTPFAYVRRIFAFARDTL